MAETHPNAYRAEAQEKRAQAQSLLGQAEALEAQAEALDPTPKVESDKELAPVDEVAHAEEPGAKKDRKAKK